MTGEQLVDAPPRRGLRPALTVGAIYLAIGLKWDDWELRTYRDLAREMGAVIPFLVLLAFAVFGLYRRRWRHATLEDLVRPTGAILLTGLGADLLAGGLTLGSGALVGGVLGAMGAAALAKGYNVYTHKNRKMVGWSGESLAEAFGKSVMLYLSIAHFGRGQGQWRRKEDPTDWTEAANEVLRRDGERLKRLWADVGATGKSQPLEAEYETEVRHFLREVLLRLYPESSTVLPEERFGADKSAG